ncbi:MAG: winged helix-turn-helix transcriptional regulator [Candidatus Heimdallarchaeota archaeon]|nr:winged helix-turn-helix transcriptional regulator [Candidatus Heimdallarchaeota archaeon]
MIKETDFTNNPIFKISKHKIRAEICALLMMYKEMNVTEITRYVKQSKATVSRHLKEMKQDKLLSSREEKVGIKGRINPVYYRFNRSEIDLVIGEKIPRDIRERMQYYRSLINTYQVSFLILSNFINLIKPYLDILLEKVNIINEQEDCLEELLIGEEAPDAQFLFFDDEEIKDFKVIRLEYMNKIGKLFEKSAKRTDNKGKEYFFFDGILPLKKMLETTATVGNLKKDEKE